MIKNILSKYGASIEEVKKDELIFELGEIPTNFIYIKKGVVRIYTLSEQGKEFTHKLFYKNDAVGVPPLLINKPYPSIAIAKTDVEIFKLPKDKFFQALDENPQVLMGITQGICETLYFKSVMSAVISLQDPAQRISTLLEMLKKNEAPEEVLLTRQQIANLTALRVETVIRTIKKMEQDGFLKIVKRKIYF